MLGFIPIIGPLINLVTGIFGKYEDTQLGKYTVDGKVDVAAMNASANIIESTKDDPGVRLCRDLIMFPVAVWTSLVTWDNIIIHLYPTWVIVVEKYPDGSGLEYLPYAVLTFLFGSAAMKVWSRS